MKRILLILTAALALTLIPSSAFANDGGQDKKMAEKPQPAGGLVFMSYAEATKKAAEEDKLVMIFFWADWCRYCIQIRKEVFSLDRVKEAFDKYYIGVSVDTENDPDNLTGRFRPKALPTLAFVRPNGEVLGIMPGAPNADTFIEILDYVNKEARKK